MFFFEFFNPIPIQQKPRRARKSSKPRPTPYTQDGRYTRGQKVTHPQYGPGVITLVRVGMIVILFDAEKQNPPQLELCGIPVKGRRFLSARIDLAERDKANGGTFAHRRARNIANLAVALRRKKNSTLLGVHHWWMPLVHPGASLGSVRWQRQHSTISRRLGARSNFAIRSTPWRPDTHHQH